MEFPVVEDAALLREYLRLAADVIENLAEQQAMHDDWYEAPLSIIEEAGRE